MTVDGLLARLRGLFIAAGCPLCTAPALPGRWCGACVAALPWNDIACPGSAEPLAAAGGRCTRCANHPPHFDAALAAFRYAAPIDHAIHALKYEADFSAARRLGDWLAERAERRAAPLPDLLLPVPLHPARLRRRGYNQALLLANAAGRRLSLPVAPALARRVRATPDQIGTDAAARRRNVRGAFEITGAVDGRHIALVDDVLTTGATADALAAALKKAGAARVEAWVVARVA